MLILCAPQRHAPLALALAGLPGAGKSTLARRLSQVLGWPLLDRDQLRAEAFPGQPAELVRDAADRLLHKRLGSALRAGLHCLVDGKSFATQGDRLALAEVVEDTGAELLWCWLDLSPDLAGARLASQEGHPADNRDRGLVHAVAARWQGCPQPGWRLDASAPPDAIERQTLLHLAQHLSAVLVDDQESAPGA